MTSPLLHDIERLRIAVRRMAVAVLRVAGVESPAHMRRRVRESVRRDQKRFLQRLWMEQGEK
jgi:hypothetical protein